jgi:hypothetical protein
MLVANINSCSSWHYPITTLSANYFERLVMISILDLNILLSWGLYMLTLLITYSLEAKDFVYFSAYRLHVYFQLNDKGICIDMPTGQSFTVLFVVCSLSFINMFFDVPNLKSGGLSNV